MEKTKAQLEKDLVIDRLTEYVDFMKNRSDKQKLVELSEFRKLPLKAIEEADIFYVGNMVEMLVPEFLGDIQKFGVISPTNMKPIFNERWVIPIKDIDGRVKSLVGYSPTADERYVYGIADYYRRRDTLYGLEDLELAYELGYAVLVEGITDRLRLKSMGIKNSFSNCGSHESKHNMEVLNRCRYGIIRIPDRDGPGLKTEGYWKTNRYLTLHTFIQYKDSDEMLREEENIEWFWTYFNEAVRRITSMEHRGILNEHIEITMV